MNIHNLSCRVVPNQFILLDKKDLAARWKCSVSKIDKMIRAGELPFVKIGSLVRFLLEDIEDIERNGVVKFVGTTHSPGCVAACTDDIAPTENTGTYTSGKNGKRW